MKIPIEIFQVAITWSPSHLSNQVSSPPCFEAPSSSPLSAYRPQAFSEGSVHLGQTGSFTVGGNTWKRARPFPTFHLSGLTILCPAPYLSRPAGLGFLNFETFIQILIETKNTFREEPKESILHIPLPHRGRGWEDFPPCS